MLHEVRNEKFGSLVWSTFHVLITWLGPQRETGEALAPRQGIDRFPESSPTTEEPPGGTLAVLLAETTKHNPAQRKLARAARRVSDWALHGGLTETALAYSALAAGLGNTSWDARLAGRLHRRHAGVREAETWYRSADAAASREADWESKVRALNSRGRLALDLGRYPEARRLFTRALKLAHRFRLREREAETQHHLFAAEVAMGDHARATRRSKRVIRCYGRDHPRLPSFAHDLAAYWMDRGDYGNALNILHDLLENHFKDSPAPRLLVLGSAARAAGGAGKPDEFDLFHAELDDLRFRGPETLLHAQAQLLAARGAVSLRRWGLARECLTEALESSRRTEQKDTERGAERLLTRVGWYL